LDGSQVILHPFFSGADAAKESSILPIFSRKGMKTASSSSLLPSLDSTTARKGVIFWSNLYGIFIRLWSIRGQPATLQAQNAATARGQLHIVRHQNRSEAVTRVQPFN
jgi:hypothetical protein